MDTNEIHEGGCCCGAVRYQTTRKPKRVGVCHCRYCQARTGSAFGVSVYFKNVNIEKHPVIWINTSLKPSPEDHLFKSFVQHAQQSFSGLSKYSKELSGEQVEALLLPLFGMILTENFAVEPVRLGSILISTRNTIHTQITNLFTRTEVVLAI